MHKELSQFDGFVMSGDRIIANIKKGSIIPIKRVLLPLYLQTTQNLEGWLESRAIDSHRANSRLLKKALRLAQKDDVSTVLQVHGATITDTYWVKEWSEQCIYSDIRFRSNPFAQMALTGDFSGFHVEERTTPELTNIGSFEKCWRLENDIWWMYKAGTTEEKFSELFISHLGKQLGFPMAHYEQAGEYIRTRDFTNNAAVNYEPLSSIARDNDDYNFVFPLLYGLNPSIAKEYLQIIYLDTLVYNADRHTNNLGVLRDVRTGNVICMAPNFDNNIALIARSLHRDSINRENDFFIKMFVEFLQTNPTALHLLNTMRIPIVTQQMMSKVLAQTTFAISDEQKEFVQNFVLNGQYVLSQKIRELQLENRLESISNNKSLSEMLNEIDCIIQEISPQIFRHPHQEELTI